jgi:hypothetical protein
MAKNDQQDAYEKALVTSLARVIDLVKFAEAKNAGLLAFAAACTVAIANILAKANELPTAYKHALPFSAALFLISALIALYSILPKADLAKFFKGEHRAARELNLVFYGDISKMDIIDYPQRVRDRYFPADKHSVTDRYLSDLSCQIHVNSTIATRKYALFKTGAWFSLVSMSVLVLPVVWYVISGAIDVISKAVR